MWCDEGFAKYPVSYEGRRMDGGTPLTFEREAPGSTQNPVAESTGEPDGVVRTASKDYRTPRAIAREIAADAELNALYDIFRDIAEHLANLDSANPPVSYESGIPRDSILRTMRHLGLVLTDHEVQEMLVSADDSSRRPEDDGQHPDQTLQRIEFRAMTSGAIAPTSRHLPALLRASTAS